MDVLSTLCDDRVGIALHNCLTARMVITPVGIKSSGIISTGTSDKSLICFFGYKAKLKKATLHCSRLKKLISVALAWSPSEIEN